MQSKLTEFKERSTEFYKNVKSDNIPRDLPNKISDLEGLGYDTNTIEKIINGTHPIADQKVIDLVDGFLAHKKVYGSNTEKAYYQNMTRTEFFTRLLHKRPLVFFNDNSGIDTYLLRNEHGNAKGNMTNGLFDKIGNDQCNDPNVNLENYLSYDEMGISAFLGLSSFTAFINQGERANCGKIENNEPHEKTGVYVGLVGARFERREKMEYRHMVVTPSQNTREKGYGANNDTIAAKSMQCFAQFYGVSHFPTYEEIQTNSDNFIKVGNTDAYLNKAVYKARLRAEIAPFLAEAEARAQAESKEAYLHLVGLGLGAWSTINGVEMGDTLAQLQLQVYHELLSGQGQEGMVAQPYPHIKKIRFSWFPDALSNSNELQKLKQLPEREVEYTKDDPAAPFSEADKNKLLVVQYAWDGNSYPGNEYWLGMIQASGDPAAASCSNITEVQNPEINPAQVCGENLKTYSDLHGVPLSLGSNQGLDFHQKTLTPEDEKKPVLTLNVTAKVKSAVEGITKIAEEFYLTQEIQLKTEKQRQINKHLINLSANELQTISQQLKEKNIILSPKFVSATSPKTLGSMVVDAILAEKKRLTETNNSVTSDVTTIQCEYTERSNYDYFTVTPKGDLICLIPITSCNEKGISSENTCKIGETMKKALLAQGSTQPAIRAVLSQYMSDLAFDFQLTNVLEKVQREAKEKKITLVEAFKTEHDQNSDPIIKGKIKRWLQAKQYITLLDEIIADPDLKNNLAPSYLSEGQLPQPIQTVLKNSHTVSFLIEPQSKHRDDYLRLKSAGLFSLERKWVGKAGNTTANPNYSSGFVELLKKSLENPTRKEKLTRKAPSNLALTKEDFPTKVAERYAILKKVTNQGLDTPVQTEADVKLLRQAAVDVLEPLNLPSFNEIKHSILHDVIFDFRSKKPYKDNELFGSNGYMETLTLDEVVENILPLVCDDDRQRTLIESLVKSPFNDKGVCDPNLYNDLIQIFLALACNNYHEQCVKLSTDPKTVPRFNFGHEIEHGLIHANVFFHQKKQYSLIKVIEEAIDQGQSLEDAMFSWIEKYILSNQSNSSLPKKFTAESKQQIKVLFEHTFELFFNLNNFAFAADHIDEFLFAGNHKNDPQVVVYRGTMSVPLDLYCENYEAKFWLKDKFSQNVDLPLPRASELTLEADNFNLSSHVPPPSNCQIDVMHFLHARKDTPGPLAKFLLHKTTEGKRIYSLLSAKQVLELKSFPKWDQILSDALQGLSSSNHEAKQFKDKFDLKPSMHLTRVHEQALFAAYVQKQYTEPTKFYNLSRAEKIKTALTQFGLSCNTLTKTSESTYVVEFTAPTHIPALEKIYQDSKTTLHITPEMAAYFYRRMGETSAQEQEVAKKNTRAAPTQLNQDSRLPFVIKTCFPDLTVTTNTPIKEGKGDSVIDISLNPDSPRFGYIITSSNPDNLNRIRDYYESAMTRELSSLEAGKILQCASTQLALQKPIELNAETLEQALDALNIPYTAVVQVGSLYQIVCNDTAWSKLKELKSKVTSVDPKVVDLGRSVASSEIIERFFKAINETNIDLAKQLLSENPELLNTKDKKYQSTPLISVLAVARNIKGSNQFNDLMNFCLYLIEQPGIELTHVDSNGNTALHRSIYYSYEKSYNNDTHKVEKFDQVSCKLWERAFKEGTTEYFYTTQNKLAETIYGNQNSNFDKENRIKNKFASQTFFQLLNDTRYYNFEPAFQFLTKDQAASKIVKNLVNAIDPKLNKTPLQMAILRGDLSAVKKLVDFGADIHASFALSNSIQAENETENALCLAIRLTNENAQNPELKGKYASIQSYLFSKGADISPMYQMIDRLKQEKIQLQEKLDQNVNEMQKKIDELEKQLEAEKKKFDNLGLMKNPVATETLQKQDHIQKQIEALQITLKNSEAEWENLQNKYTELAQKIEAKQKLIDESPLKIKQLDEAITLKNAEMSQFNEKLIQYQKDIETKQKEFDEIQLKYKALEANFLKVQEEHKIQEANLVQKTAEIEGFKLKIQGVETDSKQLAANLEEETAANEKIKNKIQEAKAQSKSLTAELNKQIDANRGIEKQIQAAEIQSKQLADKLEEKTVVNEEEPKQLNESQINTKFHSSHFFERLKTLPEFKKLISIARMSAIHNRIDHKSWFQDAVKNQTKITALKELQDIVNSESSSFEELQKFISKNEKIITQSTRHDKGFFSPFTGAVTSADLFAAVKKLVQAEDKILQAIDPKTAEMKIKNMK